MTGRLVDDDVAIRTGATHPVYSDEHRRLVHEGADPRPIRYVDPSALPSPAELVAFLTRWRAEPPLERVPYLLSRALLDGRVPLPKDTGR